MKEKKIPLKKNPCHLTPLSINNVLLNRVTQIRYLGILIDEHLTRSKHISRVQILITKNIGIAARSGPFINTKIALLLHFSLIYPSLTYYIIHCNITSA